MKGTVFLLACGLCSASVAMAADTGPAPAASVAQGAAAPASATALNRHEVSYAIGYRIGSEFADGQPPVDMDTLIQAVRDAYARHPPAVSMHVMDQQLDALRDQMHQQARQAFEKLAAENARRSTAFLRTNRHKPGVVELPSGVQYKVIKVGHGAAPTATSVVVINYRGALLNGLEFDNSWTRGAPVTYAVANMLPGWRDVLPRMHVGARWQVFIPPQQAYGERGQLPRIGPNEALVFDIQLLGVKR